MKIVIDTNRYTDYTAGEASTLLTFRAAAKIYIPLIVLAELRSGFAIGTRPESNEKTLQALLSVPRVEILYPDDDTTRHYAAITYQLRKQATPIPTNDIWIAALTLQHGLTLYTRDRHFNQLPQIPRA